MPSEDQMRKLESIRERLESGQGTTGPPQAMQESKGPADNTCHRELAQSILRQQIDHHVRRAKALGQLLSMLPEQGSNPLEEAVWELLIAARSRSRDW